MKDRRYKQKRNKGRMAAALLALICLGAAAFFAGRLWYEEQEYQKGDDTYDLLRELATVVNRRNPVPPLLWGRNQKMRITLVKE